MWVNKDLFQTILNDNKQQADDLAHGRAEMQRAVISVSLLREQKAKDDITIDWLRHRVNALEKQNSVLVQKVAGVSFPVPEIVPTRPGTISPGFDTLPSFEDVGDSEAARLGIGHLDDGTVTFADVEKRK